MIRTALFLSLSLVFVCRAAVLNAQIIDNFADGNFTTDPVWEGASANFIVNAAGELQLNAPDAGTSALAVQGNITDSTIWTLDFRMAFAPSTSNLLRIYLMADQASLLNSNAYYLEIGENGSADALRFYRQDGASSTLLATGILGLVGTDPVAVKINMKRSPAGLWTLEAGPQGGSLQPQFSFTDATYKGGQTRYFGFYCLYSATRKNLFYFDNISILPDLPDTNAPTLLSVNADNATVLTAVFDEDLEKASAENPANYSIDNGVGAPASASLQADQKTVQLNLSNALASGNYKLEISGIKDLAGNASPIQTAPFSFVNVEPAAEFDILINEVMADPAPSAGLPEVEWIELYNRSSKTIALNTLRIDDGGTAQALPTYNMLPNTYVMLATPASAAILSPLYPNTLTVNAFPSLNNDDDVLTLSTSAGAIIDRVGYSINWHDDAGKKNGGWSLERINPTTPCLGSENWRSCPVLPGGTPGAVNAALSLTPDATQPSLLSAFPESATTVLLTFSEGLDKVNANNVAGYSFEPTLDLLSATQSNTDRRIVTLQLGTSLQAGQVYKLTVNQLITDCAGNSIPANSPEIRVGLPEIPAVGDMVANEILCNPLSGGSRYVEYVNVSKKIFSLEKFYLANFNNGSDIEPILLKRLVFPDDYVVFTANPDDIISRYDGILPEQVLSLSGPSYGDDADNLTLYWSNNGQTVVLDSLNYTDDWHNALYSISDREGVALERIRTDQPTNLATNWTSASPIRTGAPGTPTLPNSQQLNTVPANADLIQLPVKRLSPDDDGREDFLDILYVVSSTGFAASVTIYDADGSPVKRIVRQELVGTEGSLRWDGDSDEGIRVRPGIYILYFEIFHPDGTVKHEKQTVSVVKKF